MYGSGASSAGTTDRGARRGTPKPRLVGVEREPPLDLGVDLGVQGRRSPPARRWLTARAASSATAGRLTQLGHEPSGVCRARNEIRSIPIFARRGVPAGSSRMISTSFAIITSGSRRSHSRSQVDDPIPERVAGLRLRPAAEGVADLGPQVVDGLSVAHRRGERVIQIGQDPLAQVGQGRAEVRGLAGERVDAVVVRKADRTPGFPRP